VVGYGTVYLAFLVVAALSWASVAVYARLAAEPAGTGDRS
jgi:hypothetical protein